MSFPRGPAGNSIPKGYKAGQLQQFTPDQLNLFQQLFSHVSPGSQLSQLAGGSEEAFAPQEQLAQRGFQEFQGQLGSRFSAGGGGPGAMSARRSSGFQNAGTQGAQDFALQLKAQRQDLQRQALLDLFGLSESLLGQRPYEQFLVQKQQKKPSFLSQLFGGASAGAGQIGGLALARKFGLGF